MMRPIHAFGLSSATCPYAQPSAGAVCHVTRRGFSLLELLVVIAILGVLVGLVLPAIQKVRESSSRTRCQNTLRQVGLAAASYEVTNGRYPPGATTEKAKPPLPQKFHGWAVFLLPYLEQGSTVAGYDWDKDWDDPDSPNMEIARRPMPLLVCPSTAAPPTQTTGGKKDGLYVTDYRPLDRIRVSGALNLAGPGGLMEAASPPDRVQVSG